MGGVRAIWRVLLEILPLQKSKQNVRKTDKNLRTTEENNVFRCFSLVFLCFDPRVYLDNRSYVSTAGPGATSRYGTWQPTGPYKAIYGPLKGSIRLHRAL